MDQIEYQFSVNYKGQTLTLVQAPKGTELDDVIECARLAHRSNYHRVCDEVRLADVNDRPECWVKNPLPYRNGDLFILVVDWEPLYPDVCRKDGEE